MRVREGDRSVAGFRGWLSGRGSCAAAVVAVVVGMPLVGAAHAPAALRYWVTRTIPVGGHPEAVAVDPASRTVYVANGYGDTVSVIDEATGAVTRTIRVGASPQAVAVDPAARTVYVTSILAGTVSVIDAATGTVTSTIPVGYFPEGVAVDPAARTVYVTKANQRYGTDTVLVVDEAASTVTATIPVGSEPAGVAVDPDSHTAYVANAGAGTVSVISRCMC